MSLAQYSGKLLVQDGKARTGCCCTQCRPNDDCCHPYVDPQGNMPGLIAYPNLWAAYPTISTCSGFNFTCDGSSSPVIYGLGSVDWGYRFIGAYNSISGAGIKIAGELPTQKEVTDALGIDFTSHHQSGIGSYIQAQEVKTYKGYALLTLAEAPTSSTTWVPYVEQAQYYGSYCRHYFAAPLFSDEYLQWAQSYATAVSNLYSAGKKFVVEPSGPFLCAPNALTVPDYFKWEADKWKAKNDMFMTPQVFLLYRGNTSQALASGNCVSGTLAGCTYKVTYTFQDDQANPYGEYPDSVPTDFCWNDAGEQPSRYSDVADIMKSAQGGGSKSYTVSFQAGTQNCDPITVSYSDVKVEAIDGQ